MTPDQVGGMTLARSQRVPDILDVIAALSSDAVPTPPLLARALLDLLPAEVWANPDYRWFDPATKSGSILREIAHRLMEGLSTWEADPAKRAEHILRNMLYGCAITQVHGEMTRRSVYISRDATSDLSAVRFDSPEGNLPFVPTAHDYPVDRQGVASGPCRVCSAPPGLERGESRENYAHAFIHGTYPTEEMREMQFDIVVGNPPYQISADGTTRTMPVYQYFVQKAKALNPKYIAMITPSRWFAGGLGLDEFRDSMLADRRFRTIVDNPRLFDCFPGVEIKGGVSYFLWDRDHDGDCDFSTRIEGRIASSASRDLRDGDGVLIRDNSAALIVAKVRDRSTNLVSDMVQPRLAFNDKFRTNFRGSSEAHDDTTIPLIFNSGVGYVRDDEVLRGRDLVAKWKVLIPKAGDGHGREVSYVLGEPIAVAPGSVCTETYFVAGAFDSSDEAENFAYYLASKFARFLVLQRKNTQDLTSDRFKFVPLPDMKVRWTDADLYAHFRLTEDEAAYIESTIHPRSPILSLDSAIPASHLPGGQKYREPGARVETELPESDEIDEDDG